MRDDAHSSSRTDITPLSGGTAAALRNASLTCFDGHRTLGEQVQLGDAAGACGDAVGLARDVEALPDEGERARRAGRRGMMFSVAAHESRRSFIGWSVSACVLV